MKKNVEVEAIDLSYSYNKGTESEVVALKNVNLHIKKGEIIAIIGPSGSGKSTLLQHLNGLILPQNGDVLIEGKSIKSYKKLKDIRKKVGLLFQNPEDQIFERYVGDEIAFALFNFGYSKDKARERVRQVLNLVGYDFKFKNRLTKELSGGEKRLISFLSVIAYEPELLVLDEPTSGLDYAHKSELLRLVKLWSKNGKSVIMVSHNMDEVFDICNSVYMLNEGKIVVHGDVKEVLKDYNLLLSVGISPPGIMLLLSILKKKGLEIKEEILNQNDFVHLIREIKGRTDGGR